MGTTLAAEITLQRRNPFSLCYLLLKTFLLEFSRSFEKKIQTLTSRLPALRLSLHLGDVIGHTHWFPSLPFNSWPKFTTSELQEAHTFHPSAQICKNIFHRARGWLMADDVMCSCFTPPPWRVSKMYLHMIGSLISTCKHPAYRRPHLVPVTRSTIWVMTPVVCWPGTGDDGCLFLFLFPFSFQWG